MMTSLFSLAIPGGAAEEFCVETEPNQTLFSQVLLDISEEASFEFVGSSCIDVEDCFPLVPWSFDPNNDGDINILDAVACNQFIIAVLQLTECEQLAADGNQDGVVDVLDTVSIINIITGKLPPP